MTACCIDTDETLTTHTHRRSIAPIGSKGHLVWQNRASKVTRMLSIWDNGRNGSVGLGCRLTHGHVLGRRDGRRSGG